MTHESSWGGNKVTDKSWTEKKKTELSKNKHEVNTKLVNQIRSQQTAMVVVSKAAIRCCDYFTHLFEM